MWRNFKGTLLILIDKKDETLEWKIGVRLEESVDVTGDETKEKKQRRRKRVDEFICWRNERTWNFQLRLTLVEVRQRIWRSNLWPWEWDEKEKNRSRINWEEGFECIFQRKVDWGNGWRVEHSFEQWEDCVGTPRWISNYLRIWWGEWSWWFSEEVRRLEITRGTHQWYWRSLWFFSLMKKWRNWQFLFRIFKVK